MARLAAPYLPRRPTETVLYRVVRDHLETFLAHARESYERPLPRYVEKELRGYLQCGVFAHGFLRCRCDACGHDLLVAFSCKGRGVCPSCAGRRMANTGAHIVDRVLPDVPLRQFVLSLPHELRTLAAFKPDVLTALSRIFVEEVFANHRMRAERDGVERGVGGAVTLIQRFGGSLNLNVHFHVAVLDGVYSRDLGRRVRFHGLAPPERGDLISILRRVQKRSVTWLRRRAYIDPSPRQDGCDPASSSAIEACAAIAVQPGTFAKLNNADPALATDAPPPAALVAEHEGFNLHAGVRIPAGDDLGREKLVRYGARPALAMDRLRRLADGRFGYRVKYARGRSKHRVMTALELLARLSALIPPPRYPLVRFHGVLGPRSSWRKDVIPRPRARQSCPTRERDDHDSRRRGGRSNPTSLGDRPPRPAPSDARATGSAIGHPPPWRTALEPSRPSSTNDIAPRRTQPDANPPSATNLATLVSPNVLSVSHWNRLLGGELYAVTSRLDWARLLARTFAVDVQECPKCHGRLRLISATFDPPVARSILACLGMPTTAPVPSRARDPTSLFELGPSETHAT